MSYCFSTNNIIFAVKGSNCRKTNGIPVGGIKLVHI